MGDIVFKGFQCLNGDCQSFLTVRDDQIGADFSVVCPACEFTHRADGETKRFDYRLSRKDDGAVIEDGAFVVLHDDYIREAQRFKYCLLCYALKPLHLFDVHSARMSQRQGECRLCKTLYNRIKNQSRTTDQHREAAQRRRLYRTLAGAAATIDSRQVFDRFGGRCFNCDRLLAFTTSTPEGFQIDHTLPVRLLWPVSTENATLLCSRCNNEKHDRWPSEYYQEAKLRKLARLTDYSYHLLAGPPMLNTEAANDVLDDADSFIEEWIHSPEDIRRIRRIVLEYTGKDLFAHTTHVPAHLREDADIAH